MTRRLLGKRIFITGAAGGLGKAIARRLAAEGAKIAIGDIDDRRGAAIASELGGLFCPIDISKEADWNLAIAQLDAAWGGIDGLVNNAAVLSSRGGWDVETILAEDVNRIMATNVTGTILGCKTAIPLMAKSGGGSIVNMSSIAALVPTDFLLAYGASKAAVRHVTKSVALHCTKNGYNIRCNSVHPGNVMTDMMQNIIETKSQENNLSMEDMASFFIQKIPMGAWQQPEDIASAVLYLLSDEARYVTGTKLVVDGGMTLVN